jgi:carboxymethylenebutenolidase
MKGSNVEFQIGDEKFAGYYAPASAPGPAVIVIQEWWGLVGHIRDVADRFAEAGFHTFAPDFYNGQATDEPDEAGSLMMALDIEKAARMIRGAVDLLSSKPEVTAGVGVVGFCMGGKLAMFAAGLDDRIRACVNFYGIHPNVHPNYAAMNGPLLGLFAEHDDYASPAAVKELSVELHKLGKEHEFVTYNRMPHAFFNSDRPAVYNEEAAEDAWQRTVRFFELHLNRA